MPDAITLDQLRVLVTIADAGSFTAAARRLRRAQSAVSHAVAALEAQLDLALFDRHTRRPNLTPAGQAVLAEARGVLERAERLAVRARSLVQGLEAELSLAVGVVLPTPRLVGALEAFRDAFPSVRLTLHVEEIGGVAALVRTGRCGLGVSGPLGLDEGLVRRSVGWAPVVAVAEARHPLAALPPPISDAALQEHRQLVPSSHAAPAYPNTLSHDTWAVADLTTRRAMLLAGLGWGTFPLHVVEADLAAGRLVRLALASRPEAALRVPLYAVHRRGEPPGAAGVWLVERLGNA